MVESKIFLKNKPYPYDKEWIDLIAKARALGLVPAEVRYFLNKEGLIEKNNIQFIEK